MTATKQTTMSLNESRPSWQGRRETDEMPALPTDFSLRGNGTVLVVDDEPLVREVVADILRSFGYRVLEASGALAAEHLIAAGEKVNLLLTDFSMPETNGLDLARWLQARCPDLKVLIVTGSPWELENQLGDQERVTVLSKPFDCDELGQTVCRMLRGDRGPGIWPRICAPLAQPDSGRTKRHMDEGDERTSDGGCLVRAG